MLSSPTKKLNHPAYQKIISIGKPAIPLILREFERQPDHWFMALSAIALDQLAVQLSNYINNTFPPDRPKEEGRKKKENAMTI